MNIVEASYNHVIKGYPMPANSVFLKQHLAEEDRAEAEMEARNARIDSLIAESMMEGGEFYPFSMDNFDEAMRNLPDGDMEALRYAYISVPANQTVESYLKFHEKCKGTLTEYWKERATNHFNDPKNWG